MQGSQINQIILYSLLSIFHVKFKKDLSSYPSVMITLDDSHITEYNLQRHSFTKADLVYSETRS